MKISIKWALVFSFTLVIIVSIGFISTSSYLTSKNALLFHAQGIMKNIITFTADKSKKHILAAKDASELTQGLTSSKVVNSENFKGMEKYFFEQLKVNKQFANIYYGNKDGRFIMVSRDKGNFRIKSISFPHDRREVTMQEINKNFEFIHTQVLPQDNYDPRKRPWYKSVKKYNKTIWTDPYIFFESKHLGITAASPVFGTSNKIQGAVGVDMELNELSKFLSKLDFNKVGKVFIFDKNMNTIAASNAIKIKADNIKIDKTKNKVLSAAINSFLKITDAKKIDNKVFTSFTYKNKDYNTIFSPFSIDEIKWIIGIYIDENTYLGGLKQQQIHTVYIAILIAIIFLFISYLIANRIYNPIMHLHNVAQNLKIHNLNIPKMPLSSFAEIRESAEAFNDMKEEIISYTEEANRLNKNLQDAYLDTLYRLALASEYKDNDTAEHIHRIGEYSEVIARALNLDKDTTFIIKNASIMHDVGKLGIPDKILLKPGKLTFKEMEIMKTHSLIGGEILKNSSSEILKAADIIASYHHEKWDGSGYPYGLKGEDIPLMARIVAVVDVFDALVNNRSYKKAFSIKKAVKIINEGRGSHFDPACVDAFNQSFKSILKIYKKFSKSS